MTARPGIGQDDPVRIAHIHMERQACSAQEVGHVTKTAVQSEIQTALDRVRNGWVILRPGRIDALK
jgi:hypothetical protein